MDDLDVGYAGGFMLSSILGSVDASMEGFLRGSVEETMDMARISSRLSVSRVSEFVEGSMQRSRGLWDG